MTIFLACGEDALPMVVSLRRVDLDGFHTAIGAVQQLLAVASRGVGVVVE
jgi:hypothetical protein